MLNIGYITFLVKGARKIYHVNHHRPYSAVGATKNHFIDPPNKKYTYIEHSRSDKFCGIFNMV